jgi:hypothetical protein
LNALFVRRDLTKVYPETVEESIVKAVRLTPFAARLLEVFREGGGAGANF